MVTNVPTSVGYIRVHARGITAYADSVDEGERPDAKPMVGTVRITPTIGKRPIVAIKEDPKTFLALTEITAYLDADGNLRPPDDGKEGFPVEDGELILVAPDQPENISVFGWSWTAHFRPSEGQNWDSFQVNFRGEPDETIDLVEQYLEGEGRSRGAFSPLIHKIPGPYEPGVDPVPVGVKAGEYLLDESTGDFYLVQSETTTDFLLNVLWSAERLYEMKDVDVGDRKDGDLLAYDKNTDKWVPKTQPKIPTTLGSLEDVSEGVPKEGEVLTWNAVGKNWESTPLPKIYEELSELKDVSVPQPREGEVLTWNDIGQSWEATPLPKIYEVLSELKDVSVTQPKAGEVLTWNDSTKKWGSNPLPKPPARLEDLSNVSNAAPSAGSLLSYDGNNWAPTNLPEIEDPRTKLTELDDVRSDMDPSEGDLLIYDEYYGRWTNINSYYLFPNTQLGVRNIAGIGVGTTLPNPTYLEDEYVFFKIKE